MVTLFGLLASPVAADPPNIGEQEVAEFTAWNPCLNMYEDHTVIFTPFDHFHANNEVIRDKDRHGFTESGFLLKGVFHVVFRPDGVFWHIKDKWRNPVTHDMFHFEGTFRVVGNAPVVEESSLTCITGPTYPEPLP
jgi:hypothetical protein